MLLVNRPCTMLSCVLMLAFAAVGSCLELEDMPSRFDIESSINRTVEEVEKMIQDNPTLPKLSRDEIVNILHNITSTDIVSMEGKALEAIKKTREDYQRALMVVLPYKPNDTEESLTELYTKPPMVQIVPDDEVVTRKDSKIETIWSPSFYPSDNVQQSENLIENKHQIVIGHMRFDDSEQSKKSEDEVSTSTTTTTTTTTTTVKPTSIASKTDSAPQKFTFNLNINDQRADSSQTSIATKRPIYKGTFSRYRTGTRTPPKLEIIYSTDKTTTTTPTPTTFKIETTSKLKPSRATPTTAFTTTTTTTTTTTMPTTITSKVEEINDSPWKPMALPGKDYFLPTVQSKYNEREEPNFSDVKEDDFKKIMETVTTAKPSPIFVTPSAITNHNKVNLNIKTIPSGFKLTTTTAPSTAMREEVAHLLKTIGLQPMKPTVQKNNQISMDTQKNVKNNSNVEEIKFDDVLTDLSKVKKNNSFESSQSNIKNLSPDIQLLFQRFGLQIPGKENTPSTSTTVRPTIPSSVNSYTHFKPLPTSSVRDKDFRNFLARFGLGTGENRNQKAMQSNKSVTRRPSLIDAVPGNMRKILENIGLIKKSPKMEKEIRKETVQKTKMEVDTTKIAEQTTPVTEHIFKPHEIAVDDREQKEKIKNLLNTVRMVQEGKADVQDVQKVAHELLQSTKTLANGPDPLKLEEILNNYRNSLKNEVKRQQEQTTTTTTTTTEASTTREIKESTLSDITSTVAPVVPDENIKSAKTDQASSSSTTEQKSSKPSFFDTFDISDYLNKTDNATTSSTTAASNSASTTKSSSFFDNFNIDDYTTTENSAKNANANLSDLENSFGGSTAEPDPIIPTRPKTGLYFLLDWNSFLEVGEEGKDKVNLRFAPKVGDRTRFIPVKIP